MVKVGDWVQWAHGKGDQKWAQVKERAAPNEYRVLTDDGELMLWSVRDVSELIVREAVHPTASSGAQREKMNVLPYDLVPFQEIADAYSRVAEKGAEKYSAWNWSKGLARVQLIGSLLRHTFAYLRGEDFDKETRLSHTDHILWNAVALSHNVHHGLEDGRRIEPEREYKA